MSAYDPKRGIGWEFAQMHWRQAISPARRRAGRSCTFPGEHQYSLVASNLPSYSTAMVERLWDFYLCNFWIRHHHCSDEKSPVCT